MNFKFLLKLRIQILILSLIGWAVAFSIDRTVIEEYRNKSDDIFRDANNFEMVRSRGQNAALIILSLFETGIFGLGVSFFITLGFRVFKIKNSMLKKRMVWCWATISYFLVTWWPHSSSHFLILTTGSSPIDNYITMETTFHWTITFCSSTLAYFQYDLILLMYDVAMMRLKMKSNGKEVDPLKQEWYKNYHYHAFAIGIIIFAAAVPVAFHFEPIVSSYKTYQKFFYVTFHLVNSLVAAVGFAFAYAVTRTILLLPPSPGKKVSIVSSVAIVFLFIIQYIHPFVHTHTALVMNNVVAIDYGFHVPIVVATGVLAFYQFRMMELATDEKSSLSIAVRMRRDSKAANNNGSIKSTDNASQSQSSNNNSFSVTNNNETISPPLDNTNNNNSNSNSISIEMKKLEDNNNNNNNNSNNSISIEITKE